ncbi:MAG: YafY family transcriptional regulator [Verrucomicrobia bacterium]|nr:YafY family transcriptional regulator [Verrucomicrobiota bacterium]
MRIATRPQLQRLAVMDRCIRSGEYPTARKMAAELGVAPRTIHRDIRFLRDAWSAPIVWSDEHQGFFYSESDYQLPLQTLTEGELVALFLAERLLQQYRGTPYATAIATAFAKLTNALPEKVTLDLKDLAETLSVRPAPVPNTDIKVFALLARAVREGLRLRIVYEGMYRGEHTEREIDPYHLAAASGGFCVYAYCHLREDIRTFRPSRIRRIKETGERFERPADFDVTKYFDGSFGIVYGDKPLPVRLLLSGLASRYVLERKWHPTQKEHRRRDGKVEISFRLTHLAEIKRWALAWGSECEALAPAELRRDLAAQIASLQAVYSKKLSYRVVTG